VSVTVGIGKGAGGSKMARSARTAPLVSTPKANVRTSWKRGPRMKRFSPAPRVTMKVATITNVESPIGLPQKRSRR